jgi:hypothetical protein
MRKKIRVHYPWLEVPPKGGFFVPTLKFEEVKVNGLKAALYHQVVAKAEVGRKDGKIGVWFTRVR